MKPFSLFASLLLVATGAALFSGCPFHQNPNPEGEEEGEGMVEGAPEGMEEGEGAAEGDPEGMPEGEGTPEGEGALEGEGEGVLEGEGEGAPLDTWPGMANEYSWDGSWNPAPGSLPPDGLFDDVYFDGHITNGQPSPILPPGAWDFVNPNDGSIALLAPFRFMRDNIGTFDRLTDGDGNDFGWILVGKNPAAVMWQFYGDPYSASPGVELLDLGPGGRISQTGALHLRDGPDMVRTTYSFAADWRTGSQASGRTRDNDLVIAGREGPLPAQTFDFKSSTVHTGPGRDYVLINHFGQAAVDLGLGAEGRTDTIDPFDDDDFLIIGGNAYDFRVMGGAGNDTFVWRVDEVTQNTPWLGPNFFGAGAWPPALWDDGIDRLVLDVPVTTEVREGTDGIGPGAVAVWVKIDYQDEPVIDPPVQTAIYDRYVLFGGLGPGNKKTLLISYTNVSGTIHTGNTTITSIEELQVGIGPGARVYRLNEVTGQVAHDPALEPTVIPLDRADVHQLFDTFAGM